MSTRVSGARLPDSSIAVSSVPLSARTTATAGSAALVFVGFSRCRRHALARATGRDTRSRGRGNRHGKNPEQS